MKHFDALIGRAASSLTQRRGDNASASDNETEAREGLVFMGNPHETVPRALLVDQRLGAVDVLGWQMIRLLSNSDRTTAFPTYDELEPLLRSSAKRSASRKTVARVIAVLRLTRWMTLGLKARNTSNARMIGNVYVLHDEPLSPAESLSLDVSYVEYVVQCMHHKNHAVAEVANLVRDELAETGVLEVPSRLDIIEKRAEQQRRAEFPKETQGNSPEFPAETQGNKPSFQKKLRQFPEEENPSFQRKLRHESTTYGAVSKEQTPTTTGSYTYSVCNTTVGEEATRSIVWSWPLELTSEERESATVMLTGLSHELQQSVIDELAGRVEAGKVKSTLGMLHTLAKRANDKTFHFSHYGKKVAEKRQGVGSLNNAQQHAPVTSIAAVKAIPPKPPEPIQPLSSETQEMREDLLRKMGIKR